MTSTIPGRSIRRAAWLALAASLAVARPAGAQSASSSYTTELELTFGYAGGKTDEPVVASGGVPSPDYAYRADSTSRFLAIAATRTLTPVPDDGVTPRALLAYVARLSSATARLDLEGTARDSAGLSRGAGVTLDSRLTGDRTTGRGLLGVEAYLLPWGAVRGSFAATSVRGNDTTLTTESPSGLGSLGSQALRSTSATFSLGLVARLPHDASVALDGTYGSGDATRTDRSAFTGGGVRQAELLVDSRARALSLSGRVLLLSRRLDLVAAATYTEVDADLGQAGAGNLDASHRIERRLAGEAWWYVSRDLGAGLVAAYESDDESSGLVTPRPSLTGRESELGLVARWFPRPGASVALRLSRTRADRVIPPGSSSFQRFVDTTDRAELTAALRF